MKTIAKSVNFINANKKIVTIFLLAVYTMYDIEWQASILALATLTCVCSFLAWKARNEECEPEEKIELTVIVLLGLISTINFTMPFLLEEIVGLIEYLTIVQL